LHFPPFFLLGLRLSLVVLFVLPFIRPPRIPMTKIVNASVTLAVLHFGFMFLGLKQGAEVAVTAVIDQMRVPFSVLLSYLLFKDKLSVKGMIGMGIALIGVFFIMGTPNVVA